MQSKFYGQLDLTLIGQIVKQQPELVKKVNFKKDGKEHQLINVSILVNDDGQPNQYGKVGAVRMDCKEKKDGISYFVGDLKLSGFSNQQAPQPQQEDRYGDLPF
jgi:hypothetical protein